MGGKKDWKKKNKYIFQVLISLFFLPLDILYFFSFTLPFSLSHSLSIYSPHIIELVQVSFSGEGQRG